MCASRSGTIDLPVRNYSSLLRPSSSVGMQPAIDGKWMFPGYCNFICNVMYPHWSMVVQVCYWYFSFQSKIAQ